MVNWKKNTNNMDTNYLYYFQVGLKGGNVIFTLAIFCLDRIMAGSSAESALIKDWLHRPINWCLCKIYVCISVSRYLHFVMFLLDCEVQCQGLVPN